MITLFPYFDHLMKVLDGLDEPFWPRLVVLPLFLVGGLNELQYWRSIIAACKLFPFYLPGVSFSISRKQTSGPSVFPIDPYTRVSLFFQATFGTTLDTARAPTVAPASPTKDLGSGTSSTDSESSAARTREYTKDSTKEVLLCFPRPIFTHSPQPGNKRCLENECS